MFGHRLSRRDAQDATLEQKTAVVKKIIGRVFPKRLCQLLDDLHCTVVLGTT